MMLLYLVQHAEAKKEEEDPLRPLSEKGLQDIKKVAVHLARMNFEVARIFHSNKLRARQTAELLSENLKPYKGVSETDGITPLDDPHIWGNRLKEINDNIMLVGHLPHLGKLASLLLCGDAGKNIVLFKMAGVVCIERDENGNWSLKWMLIPEVLPLPCETAEGSPVYEGDSWL